MVEFLTVEGLIFVNNQENLDNFLISIMKYVETCH